MHRGDIQLLVVDTLFFQQMHKIVKTYHLYVTDCVLYLNFNCV
jgi:hypothetical protein